MVLAVSHCAGHSPVGLRTQFCVTTPSLRGRPRYDRNKDNFGALCLLLVPCFLLVRYEAVCMDDTEGREGRPARLFLFFVDHITKTIGMLPYISPCSRKGTMESTTDRLRLGLIDDRFNSIRRYRYICRKTKQKKLCRGSRTIYIIASSTTIILYYCTSTNSTTTCCFSASSSCFSASSRLPV